MTTVDVAVLENDSSWMWRMLWFLLCGITISLVILVVIYWVFVRHWLAVHTGTVNESGPFYGFWSGFGSDIGEYSVAAGVGTGVIGAFRHVNCMEPKCPLPGHPIHHADGTVSRSCHKHHPTHPRKKRSHPLAHLHQQHTVDHLASACTQADFGSG